MFIPIYKDNKTNIHIFKDYEKHCFSTIFANIVIKRFLTRIFDNTVVDIIDNSNIFYQHIFLKRLILSGMHDNTI